MALNKYLKAIHDEHEHYMSDEFLIEFCEANGYEFKENGKML